MLLNTTFIQTKSSESNTIKNNPNYGVFNLLASNDEDAKARQQSVFNNLETPYIGYDKDSLIFVPLPDNKTGRLTTYRTMSNFPEVSDAIDEIAEAMFNRDVNDNFINLKFGKYVNATEEMKEVIRKEFDFFISLFDFDEAMYTYARNFIVEGEVAWENIVDLDNTEYGILGVKEIPTDCVDLYYSITSGNVNAAGVSVNTKMLNELQLGYFPSTNSQNIFGTVGVFNAPTFTSKDIDTNITVLPFSQVTYVNTGTFSPDRKVVYPVLEKARRVYNNLSLLEQLLIIYRLARTPARFIFNVDIGRTPRHLAEQEVFKMMSRFNQKKSVDSSGTISNQNDPISVLDSFWFMKPEGGEGTKVEPLNLDTKFGETDDIDYFRKKLFTALKIPHRRFMASESVTFEDNENISYDEFRFSRFVMRLQQRFAAALKDSFIVHLKLRKLWDAFRLSDSALSLEFVPPVAFSLYQSQRILKIKAENYGLFADKAEFAKLPLLKKYLGYTETDIRENHKELIREREFNKVLEQVGAASEIATAGGLSPAPTTTETPGEVTPPTL